MRDWDCGGRRWSRQGPTAACDGSGSASRFRPVASLRGLDRERCREREGGNRGKVKQRKASSKMWRSRGGRLVYIAELLYGVASFFAHVSADSATHSSPFPMI